MAILKFYIEVEDGIDQVHMERVLNGAGYGFIDAGVTPFTSLEEAEDSLKSPGVVQRWIK